VATADVPPYRRKKDRRKSHWRRWAAGFRLEYTDKKAKATWFREKGWAKTGWLQLLSHVLQNIFFELRREIQKVVWKSNFK
jgi:hypothetical protein